MPELDPLASAIADLGVPTWRASHVGGWRDRIGGIVIRHADGADTYLQPGDDTSNLADTLDSPGITEENIGALLCDFLEGVN